MATTTTLTLLTRLECALVQHRKLRLGPLRTLKASLAEAILRVVLRRIGLTAKYKKGEANGRDRLAMLEALRSYSRAWLHHEAVEYCAAYGIVGRAWGQSFADGTKRFFGRVRSFVRESLVAAAIAVTGPGALTDADLHEVDRQVQVQNQYLDRFEEKVLATGPPSSAPPDPDVTVPEPMSPQAVAARTASYGNATYGGGQTVARGRAVQAAFDEEIRVHLGKDEPCGTCRAEAARGWQPIGTLKPIGDSECGENCHCMFKFRRRSDGKEMILGIAI